MNVEYIDHMGTDLRVVNAARVSFKKKATSPSLTKGDIGLIQFLARGCTSGEWDSLIDEVFDYDLGYNERVDIIQHIKSMPTHWTPFGHCQVTLHMKIPIFVARHIAKHQVGFVVNEVSRRYVDDDPEFYQPDVWRKRADNVKQGSSDEEVTDVGWYPDDFTRKEYKGYNDWSGEWFPWGDATMQLGQYRAMLNDGVCPEQARMVLPQSMYTEWYMTGSLYGWANMYNQRSDSHAQRETQEVAFQVAQIVSPLYPVSWNALTL